MNMEIKSINKFGNATQTLHDYYGFDFQKPYRLIKFTGRFTINQIRKAAGEAGYNTTNAKIMVMVNDPTTWRNDRFQIVQLTATGYDIDIYSGYDSGLDKFYTKGDFENTRKKEEVSGYILAQEKFYLLPTMTVKRWNDRGHNFTAKDRYKFKEFWYSQTAKLMRTDNNGEIVEYKVYDGINEKNLSDYLDPSGYLVQENREELKQRLKEFKAERRKNEYLSQDYTAKIAALADLIDAKKDILVGEFQKATTADAIDKFRDKLGWRGFYSVLNGYENMVKKNDERSYSSIESFEHDYNNIMQTIAMI